VDCEGRVVAVDCVWVRASTGTLWHRSPLLLSVRRSLLVSTFCRSCDDDDDDDNDDGVYCIAVPTGKFQLIASSSLNLLLSRSVSSLSFSSWKSARLYESSDACETCPSDESVMDIDSVSRSKSSRTDNIIVSIGLFHVLDANDADPDAVGKMDVL